MGFQLREVYIDQLVVLCAFIGLELEEGILGRSSSGEVLKQPGIRGGLLSPCRFEVTTGSLSVGEDGSGRANFGSVTRLADVTHQDKRGN